VALREANTVIVNHHHRLELAKVFGGGTMSSSDGQRFPTRGKTLTARAMNIHFADEGLSTYTHVSDQHSAYGTKVIVPTAREAHYVLDDFLGNATDLPFRKHATDTHGVTLVNFALHALRRDLHYANQGTIRKAHLEQQTEQAWCLTVLTNAVVTWSTEYYCLAVAELRAAGRDIPNEVLAHISPAHSENINFFGVITVDVEAELAKLDGRGLRPLRAAGTGQASSSAR